MTLSPEHRQIKQLLEHISNKRARIVIEHILEHEFITTEQLEKQYGYNHPPRAARDVRELGIPLETFRVKDSAGRTIAAYRFGNLQQIRRDRLDGRQTFPKKFRDALYLQSDKKCLICNGIFEQRYLQVDHRIPYEIVGEMPNSLSAENFMLVCSSCNRAKSWSCEHCPNWQNDKHSQICSTCYWASPQNYLHISLKEIRRTDILWSESEIELYEKLQQAADQTQFSMAEYIKKIIAKYFSSP